MCRFKSGIILKTRCVVAQGADDSHTNLLEKLGIDDTMQNAMTKFVRAELIPPNDKWWTDPDSWNIKIDQDITPDWFNEDIERYISEFKEAVKQWWENHIFVGKKIDELSNGYYRLIRCEVKRLLKDVQVMCDSSSVKEMHDCSSIQEMRNSSSVQEMYDSSSVQKMYDCSSIQEMYGSSSVHRMHDYSSVHRMHDYSSVHRMHDYSSVQEMYDYSSVQKMYGSSSIQEMYDCSSVQEMYDCSSIQEMYDSSSIQEMHDYSSVQEMYGSSIARDYSHNIIHISPESKLKPVIHENKKGE